ncbi:SAC3/GANP/Nin1/mts3/eIF-3 p25 family domain containing protein [Hyaloscypha variabilis]
MLRRGSSSRAARGSTPSRSSNRSRGQGSTGRGASSSSSTSSSGPNSPNPFDQERAENAAKRMHRGQNGTMVNGRGGRGTSRGGGQTDRSVRFAPSEPKPNPFAAGASPAATNPFAPKGMTTASPFGSPSVPAFNPFAPKATTNPFAPKITANPAPTTSNSKFPDLHGTLAEKIDNVLSREGIYPPSWPTTEIGAKYNDPTMIKLHNDYKAYRSQARTALIRAGLLDDPDKPKKLSEALEFKGTCEDMCPDFERVSRIMDLRIDPNEREGNLPSQTKMVKALARSAAGQDAPLPSDIRTVAALRRTVDHLFHEILGDRALPDVHGFLWDRTRAIRRDFVFHSSMTPTELVDQVYCLEHITRFHVTALHQMSKENLSADKFSEQQELEQLGKSILSLIHTYEDCKAQRVICENEAEFRAYYVLFNSHDPGILDTVQTWGYKFWKESEDIKVAIELVEALQNTWELHGPLKPQSANNIAQNGFSRFFTIIEDRKISYTLACFAEIYFNDIRKSALKTILGSYRKQRDQTKDWTMSKLNAYLRFDTEEEVAPFLEAHGLRTDEIDGEEYLSFEVTEISDPWPKLKQTHSKDIVEWKRGNYSLSEVIDHTVFDESVPEDDIEEEEDLFVKDDSAAAQSSPEPTPNPEETQPVPIQNSAPRSIFERMGNPSPFTPPTFSFTQKPTQGSSTPSSTPPAFSFAQQPPQKPAATTTPPVFSFAQPPVQEAVATPTQPVFSFSPQPPKESPKEEPIKTIPPAFSLAQQPQQEPVTTKAPPVFSFPPQPPKESSTTPPVFSLPPQPRKESGTTGISPAFPFAQQHPALSDKAPTYSPQPSVRESAVSPLFGTKPPAPIDRSKGYDALSKWMTLGEDGLIDQFTAYQMEKILRQTMQSFLEQETARAAQEAEDLARMEADRFRYRSLATKYGYRWRELAHRLWLKRQGREARQARREMAESMRASKAAQTANVVEEFKASTNRRRESLESLLNASGVLNGVHNPKNEIRAIVGSEHPEPSHKRQRSERSSTSMASSTNRHNRGRSDNPLRRSLLSDPSYLNGNSRIHLMSNYGAQEEGRRQVSGVQTDYFRLKARGITTLPDGTPLANSVAKNVIHQKRSFDGVQKSATPQSSKHNPVARSVPVKFAGHPENLAIGYNKKEREDLEAIKLRAKAFVSEEQKSRHKRLFTDDDEDLFERAKRVREQMDEGAKWYRKEIDKETASRSVS